MRKSNVRVVLLLLVCLLLTGCASGQVGGKINLYAKTTMTAGEFENLLQEQPLYTTDSKFVVQSEEYKALYPDQLQALIHNNTTLDVKNIVIAFVGWDSNDLPVKIKSQFDFSGGSYVKKVNYSDVNLVSGGVYGNNSGLFLDSECTVHTVKSLVVSFEAFSGETWENPYYNDFCKLYEGKKLSGDMSVEVNVVENTFSPATNAPQQTQPTGSLDQKGLEEALMEQPLAVIETEYVVQNDEYKALYPDLLQAIIQNNTQSDIKNVVVAFVAWDKNNLPVKIKGSIDFTEGSYVKKVDYSDVNLIPGGTYGSENGYAVDEKCNIETFKAIVVSYEDFDGNTWENPFFDDFCSLYKGKKLG